MSDIVTPKPSPLRRVIALLMAATVLMCGLLTFLVLDTFFLDSSGSGNAVIYPYPEGMASSANCRV